MINFVYRSQIESGYFIFGFEMLPSGCTLLTSWIIQHEWNEKRCYFYELKQLNAVNHSVFCVFL